MSVRRGSCSKVSLVEAGGGFVSCRSPRLQPPLDLSPFSALQLDVEGEGRTLEDLPWVAAMELLGLTELIPWWSALGGGCGHGQADGVTRDHACPSLTFAPPCAPNPLGCRCALIRHRQSHGFSCCIPSSAMRAISIQDSEPGHDSSADPFHPRLCLELMDLSGV